MTIILGRKTISVTQIVVTTSHAAEEGMSRGEMSGSRTDR